MPYNSYETFDSAYRRNAANTLDLPFLVTLAAIQQAPSRRKPLCETAHRCAEFGMPWTK